MKMSDENVWNPEELTCKPIRSVEDMAQLLQDPPPWRSLCRPREPHSPLALRNIEITQELEEITVERPQTFCHFSTEMTDVKRHEKKKLPKTLICHDMANGYHDDCYVDGTGNHDAYTFYNWAAVDIFCYFSHHFVTVPPLGWINVAHAHGAKVLGTLITEWAEGEAAWDRILASEAEWRRFAGQLVAVAKLMKFDGWLLNVENKVRQPTALAAFVRCLRAALHRELPEPELLWYDSVTAAGDLVWQNELNDNNQVFFDACDGIFTNYAWSEAQVAASAARAGARRRDVYVGVDVWGRNFLGGGQFNTQEAVKIVHKHGCSLAVFAPAWTHEAIPAEGAGGGAGGGGGLPRLEQFLLRERALWGSLWPFLTTRLPSRLPFQTSFCRGQGVKRRLYGEVIGPVSWYNLRHMQYQPNSNHGPHGYILTTAENVINVSKKGFVKDDNGVIRYREGFLEAASATPKIVSDHTLTDHVIVVNEEESVEEGEESEPVLEEKTVNRKMRDVLGKIFKVKTRSRDQISGANSKHRTEVSDTVVHVSVNIHVEPPKNKAKYMRYGLAKVPGELECLQPYFGDSFTGGSCLKVNPGDAAAPAPRTIRLFHTDFLVDDTLVACVVTKSLPGLSPRALDLLLHVTDGAGQRRDVWLAGGEQVNAPGGGEAFRALQRRLLLQEPGFYVPTENAHGWLVRYHVVRARGRVTSVAVRGGPLLLGHLGLCQLAEINEEVLSTNILPL